MKVTLNRFGGIDIELNTGEVSSDLILATENGQHNPMFTQDLANDNCPSFNNGPRHGTNQVGNNWQ